MYQASFHSNETACSRLRCGMHYGKTGREGAHANQMSCSLIAENGIVTAYANSLVTAKSLLHYYMDNIIGGVETRDSVAPFQKLVTGAPGTSGAAPPIVHTAAIKTLLSGLVVIPEVRGDGTRNFDPKILATVARKPPSLNELWSLLAIFPHMYFDRDSEDAE
jgi:hypothetical protein